MSLNGAVIGQKLEVLLEQMVVGQFGSGRGGRFYVEVKVGDLRCRCRNLCSGRLYIGSEVYDTCSYRIYAPKQRLLSSTLKSFRPA